MAEIIEFTPKQTVFVLNFTAPNPLKMNKVGGENIAACIVEPIAGSTGTLIPPKNYLQKLRKICDKHGILLIFDEVVG